MHIDAASVAHSSMKDALAGLAIASEATVEQFRPIGDQVLVKPDSPAETYKSLIYIPQSAQKHDNYLRTGTVVAVGLGDMLPGGARGPMQSKVGDRVIYDQASNRVVRFGGEEYAILRDEQHVICIFEEDSGLPFESL